MTFQDDINRMLAEGVPGYLAREHSALFETPAITVTKSAAYLMLSVDQQLDAGLITEAEARAQGWTPYIPPPVPWRSRLRRRWSAWRERAGRKIGGWLAGVDLSERDEEW